MFSTVLSGLDDRHQDKHETDSQRGQRNFIPTSFILCCRRRSTFRSQSHCATWTHARLTRTGNC